MLVGIVILCTVVSLSCFLLSYLIWGKEKLSLVIGYHEESFGGDKTKLAKAAGLLMCEIGVLILLLPFALAYIGAMTGPIYALAVACGVMYILNDAQLIKRK